MTERVDSLGDLSPERRALLEKLVVSKRRAMSPRRSIPHRTQRSPCPLSYAQQLMWLSDQLIPVGSTYSVPIPLRLEGRLDLAALQQTLDAILERHESLRTVFQTIDGNPMQVIGDSRAVDCPLIELQGDSEAEREAEMMRRCLVEARKPFDLSRDLLLRASLFRISPTRHVLLLVTHHVAFDGASRRVL